MCLFRISLFLACQKGHLCITMGKNSLRWEHGISAYLYQVFISTFLCSFFQFAWCLCSLICGGIPSGPPRESQVMLEACWVISSCTEEDLGTGWSQQHTFISSKTEGWKFEFREPGGFWRWPLWWFERKWPLNRVTLLGIVVLLIWVWSGFWGVIYAQAVPSVLVQFLLPGQEAELSYTSPSTWLTAQYHVPQWR